MNPSYNSGGIYSSGATAPVSGAPGASGVGTPGTPIASKPPVMQMSGSSRKPKKGIIVGGILIVVALVLGILAVVMMPRGGSGGNGGGGSDSDFYKYANYILNGNTNTNTNLGEYDDTKDYAVMKAFDDENVNFFNTAQSLWNTVYERISKDESIAETSRLRGDVDWQNELMDFVVKYVNTNELDDDTLLELYIKNGYGNAITLVDKNYENIKDTIYELGADYINDLVVNNKAVLDLYAEYDARGCIIDGSLDDVCLDNNQEILDEAMTEYFESTIDLNYEIFDDALNNLAKNCFAIQESLRGGNE